MSMEASFEPISKVGTGNESILTLQQLCAYYYVEELKDWTPCFIP
jgi:hypothetical protein